jgi:hypothetical protein
LRFVERAVRKEVPDPPTGIGAARLSDAVLPDSIQPISNSFAEILGNQRSNSSIIPHEP